MAKAQYKNCSSNELLISAINNHTFWMTWPEELEFVYVIKRLDFSWKKRIYVFLCTGAFWRLSITLKIINFVEIIFRVSLLIRSKFSWRLANVLRPSTNSLLIVKWIFQEQDDVIISISREAWGNNEKELMSKII